MVFEADVMHHFMCRSSVGTSDTLESSVHLERSYASRRQTGQSFRMPQLLNPELVLLKGQLAMAP